MVIGLAGATRVHVHKHVVLEHKHEVVPASTLHQVMVELIALDFLQTIYLVMTDHVQVWLIMGIYSEVELYW